MKSFKQYAREVSTFITGQIPEPLQEIIDDEMRIFKDAVKIQDRNTIPITSQIPIENPSSWIRIPNVIACYVDMEKSTKLSASLHPNSTAKAYRLFTNTAIRIFHEFDAPYIDVKGDGVFALFNQDQPHAALAAVVTFKTFVTRYFKPQIKKVAGLDIGGHFGIDQKTVLVRKLGLKHHDGRSDRQNEVWAGKPVNMASKLASLSESNKLLVSDRYFKKLTGEKAKFSCGCKDGKPVGQKTSLWSQVDVTHDNRFDFDLAYSLASEWCENHGMQYCKDIAKYDDDLEKK